jgi:ubiquinone/menaquinone biosynthesis C-methylase UbiE
MPDVWGNVAGLDRSMQDRLADVLETRGAHPGQRALREAFLADLGVGPAARALDVGCGTGVLTRMLARHPGVGAVVGVDLAPSLLERAAELAADVPNVSFREGDARGLPFAEGSFDAVVFDSALSHIPGPEAALAEAVRVLSPGGWVGVFDGDYATTTVALGDDDPLQVCVEAMMSNSVNDRWVARRLPALARDSGLDVTVLRSLGFVDTDGAYMLTIVDRGADILEASGRLGAGAAAELKAEGRRRVREGTFFGHIAYASLVARRPA